MYQLNSVSGVGFSSPANFRIKIKGRLNKGLSDNLGGLSIDNFVARDKTPVSYLEGEVLDQAALIGILNSLYNMRCTILGVEIVDS